MAHKNTHIFATAVFNGLAIALLFVLTMSANVQAKQIESHQLILDTATQYVENHKNIFEVEPEIVTGKLDNRLALSKCTQALEAFETHGGLKGGKTVVGVRCDGENVWKIFVPMQIRLPGYVLVAASPITRGEIIDKNSIKLAKKDLASNHRSYLTRPEKVIGKQAKRDIKRGTIISPKALKEIKLVSRGSNVMILSSNASFKVRMKGKAMANGSKGDQIRVKNTNSGRIVLATVVGNGVVHVNY